MEIEKLRLLIEEKDVMALLAGAGKYSLSAEGVSISHDGIRVRLKPKTGVLSSLLGGGFEMEVFFKIYAEGGRLVLLLAGLDAGMLPMETVKSVLMKAMKSEAEKLGGASLDGDKLLLDPKGIMADRKVSLEANLMTARTESGRIVIECGRN